MSTITGSGSQTVYFGPNTSTYPSAGSVSNGENVTAKWREGTFVFIEYNITGSTQKKRGYVASSVINVTESVQTNSFTLTPKTTKPSSVYYGPNATTYPSAGSVSSGESVNQLTTDGSFTFIEYNVTGSSQKKRAYIATDNFQTTSATGYVRPITGVDFNSNGTYHGTADGVNAGGRDISIATGTDVVAVKSGTAEHFLVYYLKNDTTNTYVGFGPYIKLTFDDGTGYAIYAHLSSFVGATVPDYATEAKTQGATGGSSHSVGSSKKYTQGEKIGKTGNYGMSTGPHLHFGLILGGSNVDPKTYIK